MQPNASMTAGVIAGLLGLLFYLPQYYSDIVWSIDPHNYETATTGERWVLRQVLSMKGSAAIAWCRSNLD